MNEAEVSQYILDTFKGVDVVVNEAGSFFFYNPDRDVEPDHRFPFVTLVNSDFNDQFSDLNRPEIFRLNIGVNKETFQSRFGSPKTENDYSDYDFTALDTLLPHPVYAEYYWVCILNPDDETFKTQIYPLLVEGYQMAVDRYERKMTRTEQKNAMDEK